MATARGKRKVGITHFPLTSEEARQEKVSPRRYAGDSTPAGSKGHADGRFANKSEKRGKDARFTSRSAFIQPESAEARPVKAGCDGVP